MLHQTFLLTFMLLSVHLTLRESQLPVPYFNVSPTYTSDVGKVEEKWGKIIYKDISSCRLLVSTQRSSPEHVSDYARSRV